RESSERLRVQAVSNGQCGIKRLFGTGLQMDLVDTAVARAGLTTDPAGCGHAIAKPGHAHGAQAEPVRQLDLRHRPLVAMHCQRTEQSALGTRQSDTLARQPVEQLAIKLGHVIYQKAEPLREVSFHKDIDCKYTYEFLLIRPDCREVRCRALLHRCAFALDSVLSGLRVIA